MRTDSFQSQTQNNKKATPPLVSDATMLNVKLFFYCVWVATAVVAAYTSWMIFHLSSTTLKSDVDDCLSLDMDDLIYGNGRIASAQARATGVDRWLMASVDSMRDSADQDPASTELRSSLDALHEALAVSDTQNTASNSSTLVNSVVQSLGVVRAYAVQVDNSVMSVVRTAYDIVYYVALVASAVASVSAILVLLIAAVNDVTALQTSSTIAHLTLALTSITALLVGVFFALLQEYGLEKVNRLPAVLRCTLTDTGFFWRGVVLAVLSLIVLICTYANTCYATRPRSDTVEWVDGKNVAQAPTDGKVPPGAFELQGVGSNAVPGERRDAYGRFGGPELRPLLLLQQRQ